MSPARSEAVHAPAGRWFRLADGEVDAVEQRSGERVERLRLGAEMVVGVEGDEHRAGPVGCGEQDHPGPVITRDEPPGEPEMRRREQVHAHLPRRAHGRRVGRRRSDADPHLEPVQPANRNGCGIGRLEMGMLSEPGRQFLGRTADRIVRHGPANTFGSHRDRVPPDHDLAADRAQGLEAELAGRVTEVGPPAEHIDRLVTQQRSRLAGGQRLRDGVEVVAFEHDRPARRDRGRRRLEGVDRPLDADDRWRGGLHRLRHRCCARGVRRSRCRSTVVVAARDQPQQTRQHETHKPRSKPHAVARLEHLLESSGRRHVPARGGPTVRIVLIG